MKDNLKKTNKPNTTTKKGSMTTKKTNTAKKKVDQKDLASVVMDQIESKDVKMRSASFFGCLSALLVVSTIFTVIAISVMLTAIWNDIDIARTAQVLEFGSPGRAFFLRNAPWILVVAAALMMVALYHLLTKFDISYKYKHLTPILLVGGVLFSGLILGVTGINNSISNRVFSPLRTLESALDKNYILGSISSVEEGYIIVDADGDQYKIKMPYQERLRQKVPQLLKKGQQVKVFGKYNGDDFEAYGIVPPEFSHKIKGLQQKNLDNFEINYQPAL